MSNERYFNRTGRVDITDEHGQVFYSFRGLNFKFSYELCGNPGYDGRIGKGTVGILGLSGDDVYKWTTFCNGTTPDQYNGKGIGRNMFLSVYAGYDTSPDGTDIRLDNQTNPLFTLPIVGAWPTSPPDMWLNFSAYSGKPGSLRRMDARYDDYYNDVTTKEYCTYVARVLGAKLRWEVSGGNEDFLPCKKHWGIEGTENQIVQYLNRQSALITSYIGREPPDLATPILYVQDRSRKDENAAARRARHQDIGKIISAETGMIGFPKVKFGGDTSGQVEVTTLLRKDIDIDDKFTIKSEFIRMANATFTCRKLKFVGELRGTPWYTTLTGLPDFDDKRFQN